MNDTPITQSYIELAADIVSAYVSNNSVPASDLPSLISDVHTALARVASGGGAVMLRRLACLAGFGGGGGSIGADQVAKAAPDGHTLLFHNITFTTTTSALQFAKRARHDIEADFVPISVGAYVPLMLLAMPSLPVMTVLSQSFSA